MFVGQNPRKEREVQPELLCRLDQELGSQRSGRHQEEVVAEPYIPQKGAVRGDRSPELLHVNSGVIPAQPSCLLIFTVFQGPRVALSQPPLNMTVLSKFCSCTKYLGVDDGDFPTVSGQSIMRTESHDAGSLSTALPQMWGTGSTQGQCPRPPAAHC